MGRVTRAATLDSAINSANQPTKSLERTIQNLPAGPVVISDPLSVAHYTFQLGDASSMVRLITGGGIGAVTATVPPDIDVAFGQGAQIYVMQWGAAALTVAPGAGVSIFSAVSLSLSAQYSGLWLVKIATDQWRAGPA